MATLYEAQLERAERFLEYVKKNKDDISKSNHLLISDLMFGFFVICYHVSDHIIKEIGPKMDGPVHQYINKTPCLKVCCNICHTVKHVKPKKILTGKKIVRKLRVSRIDKSYKIEFIYDTKLGEFECFKLADDCINAWKTFFKDNNL